MAGVLGGDGARLVNPDGDAFVALGSNLGDSVDLLRLAAQRLATLSSTPLLCSSLYESTPVECPPDSKNFLNAVVRITPRTSETAVSLLKKLQDIEREFGRQPKTVLNEPRPLDLDLISFGQMRIETPELTLPHPRAHLRRFVLEPLVEIAPEEFLPGHSYPLRTLLAKLQNNEIIRRVGMLE